VHNNGVRLFCKEPLEIVSKDRFPKLKYFALKMHSMFGNTYVCESDVHPTSKYDILYTRKIVTVKTT